MLRQILRDPAGLAALALISLATLLPGTGRGGWSPGLPDAADLLLNIALFVPLGMAIRRTGFRRADHRWRKPPHGAKPEARASGSLRVALIAAFLLSAGIELAQLTVIPGRDSSPWDLAANVGGAALGAGLPAHFLVLPLIPAWLLSGWLLAPTPPSTSIWWGQWAHQFGSAAPFSGTILLAELNGVPAPDHALGHPGTDQMRAGFRAPPIRYRVSLNPPTDPSPDRVQVAGVADGVGGEVVGLWQIGWDLELGWHARGTRLGLRSPSVRWPGLLFLDPRLEAVIDAHLYSRDVTLVVSDGPHEVRHQVLLGPWQGWRLLWPVEPPRPPLAVLLSVLWSAACLGVPLVAIIVRVRRRRL